MADFPNEIRINPAIINKVIVGGVVVLLVGIGVMSSFYKVDPREHAIVLRLGSSVARPSLNRACTSSCRLASTG